MVIGMADAHLVEKGGEARAGAAVGIEMHREK
jgi:hypothetical protein